MRDCGKTKFSFVEAKQRAHRAAKKWCEPFEPYHCRICGAFHFGGPKDGAPRNRTYSQRRREFRGGAD